MWYVISLIIGGVLGFWGRFGLIEMKCRHCGAEYFEYP